MNSPKYDKKFSSVFLDLPFGYSRNKSLIINDDCLQVLSKIEKETIDMVFADPPYNIGKTFGDHKEHLTKDEYITWCKKWIAECMRIIKPSGVLCFMTATQFMPYLDCFVDEKYDVISRIIWHYDSSSVQPKKSFGSLYEPIIVVARDKTKYVFNAKDILVETRTGAIRKLIDYRKTPPQPYNDTKIPGNVWEIPRVRFLMDEYESHPTQKPEKLLERLILTFTNENDLVLDPFSGTFTTSAVAERLNRYNIGIEQEEIYCKIGLRRLNITNIFKGEKLVKRKERITKNKSKKDHLISNSTFK